MAEYQPLPIARQDPDIAAGYAAQEVFTETVQMIRADMRLSELVRAEKIDQTWRSVCTETEGSRASFLKRYRTRLAELEALIPIGPNVASSASQADAAVLHQAFRAALAEVRTADREGVRRLFADAERFDNDVLRRAVLTVAVDIGLAEVISTWQSHNPSLAAQFADLVRVRDLLSGMSVDNLWFTQAFRAPDQPLESADLPGLLEAAQIDAAFRAQQRGQRRGRG